MNILRMKNTVRDYAWGDKSFIQALIKDRQYAHKPAAELWMGAHPAAPSLIMDGSGLTPLNHIITDDPDFMVGKRTAHRFDNQLPFLLKVLAAASPLSIQAHPNAQQAKEGFARENKHKIALDNEKRNYKDALPKPEMIVALTEFHAMCGFRPYEEIVQYWETLLPHYPLPAVRNFIASPQEETFQAFFTALMNLDAGKRHALVSTLISRLERDVPESSCQSLVKDWVMQLNALYPNDIGVLSPLLLNIIVLQPYEALYLDAGVMHAYLKGCGMEIMAASDNVLRGGLTHKHIDVPELLNILSFKPLDVNPVYAVPVSDTENIYHSPAPHFCLSAIHHERERETVIEESGSAEILFCYEGDFIVENNSQLMALDKGQSVFLPYEMDGYCVRGKGVIFRARCNS